MAITVLIAEDDPMVASLHQRAVEGLVGYKVVGLARNGWEALTLAEELKPDLVVLDVYMPHLDGMAVLQRLRSMRLPSDVIMITAARDSENLQEAMRQGALDYIIKPFKLERLTDSLKSYAARASGLSRQRALSQNEIDGIMHHERLRPKSSTMKLPKGLNELTLEMIAAGLKRGGHPLTAEEIALQCGVSRVTARRYLEHMVTNHQARVELSYGTGRPSRLYTAVQ
ncbi:MAG: Transcriptional regulatory protein CitT [Firmicutes bacterium]|nr:Transcriptional regulatory protein CitT [candidate division NPL-UPA2 bacterium]